MGVGAHHAAAQVSQLGSRICVYGVGGKTSLSRALGAATGLPVIEMDALFWLPDWVERDRTEFLQIVRARLSDCPDGWVLDGNYNSIAAKLLPLADTVVWLNIPIRSTMPRILCRTLNNWVRRKRICGDNYERFGTMFQPVWKRMLYYRHSQGRVATRLREVEHAANVVELRSYRQLNDFYAALGQSPKAHRT